MNDNKIANFIYTLIRYERVSEVDLRFAYDVFLHEEEYEKCSVLMELINIGYFDNSNPRNHCESIARINGVIDNFADDIEELQPYKEKLLRMKAALEFYIDRIEEKDAPVITPPFQIAKNLEYFNMIYKKDK